MSQRFRVDGDIFEKGPRVDADLFNTDKNTHFQNDPDTCEQGLRRQFLSQRILMKLSVICKYHINTVLFRFTKFQSHNAAIWTPLSLIKLYRILPP